MRFTRSSAPTLLFLALPFAAVGLDFNLLQTGLAFVLILMLRQALILSRIFARHNAARPPPSFDKPDTASTCFVLETVPNSPFVEKVRWCLDFIGQNYREQQDFPWAGWMLFGREVPLLRVDQRDKDISIGNSADILRYVYAVHFRGQEDCDVRKFLEPTMKALELEKKFDQYGESVRSLSLHDFLTAPGDLQKRLSKPFGVYQDNVPWWQKQIISLFFPILKVFSNQVVGSSNEDALKRAKVDVEETLREVNDLLNDGRTYLLGTDYPTYVDFTFAALSAPLLLPDKFGGLALNPRSRLRLEDFSEQQQQEIVKMRNMPAGKFVMRVYDQLRLERLA